MKKIKKSKVALILDSSGSMMQIRNQAVESFNSQIKTLKEQGEREDLDIDLSVVVFSSSVNPLYYNVPVKQAKLLPLDDYFPANSTALFDAMGSTLERFRGMYDLEDEDTSFLFVIITDGQENSSREYTRENIKSQVDELQNTGKWTFTFMGTEDALSQAKDFEIPNTIAFQMNDASFRSTTDAHVRGMSQYYASLDSFQASSSFYDDVDAEPAKEEEPNA